MLFVFVSLVACGVHYDGGLVGGAEQGIDGTLILNTTITIIHHNLSLHSVRLDLLAEMVYDIFAHFVDTLLCREEGFYRCATHEFVLVVLADLVGELIEGLLQFHLIEVH